MSSDHQDDSTSFLFFVSELQNASNLAAPPPPFDPEDLKGASILAESKLSKGSRIDVFAEGRFWRARITAVQSHGFAFRYCGKGVTENGFVRREDFHKTWRFPVDTVHQAALVQALAMVAA